MTDYEIQKKNIINKIACPTVSAKIAKDLKGAFPEFAKNVNVHFHTDFELGFKGACETYVRIVGKHLDIITYKGLNSYYSAEEISHGYPIARDTLPCVAKADPEWNGESKYGMFCDAYVGELSGVDRFVDIFDIPIHDLADM
jgi:hypothetical protein